MELLGHSSPEPASMEPCRVFPAAVLLEWKFRLIFSELMQNLLPYSDRLSKFCTFKY